MSDRTDHRYVMIRELWNRSPEHKQLLEDALYHAVQKHGGFAGIAQEIKVPVEDLILCDWDSHIPDGYILKKLFPLLVPELDGAITRCMERRARIRVRQLYDQYKLDEDNDFGEKLEKLISSFEGFSESEETNEFVGSLCTIIELMSDDFDA